MVIAYIIQLLSVFASFGVIAMTYHVYKLSHKHALVDNYLKQIITLYYKIEESLNHLVPPQDSINDRNTNRYYREIRVNCTLMSYYLKRYPGFYKNRAKFIRILNDIIDNPEEENNLTSLSILFGDFCDNVKENSKGESLHIFSKGKECGFPEEDA